MYKDSYYSVSLLTLIIFHFLDYRHASGYEVVSYGGFGLHFLND